MLSYVALLRGVNVGGNNKLVMADLLALMENSGLDEVKSHIQSGNLLFKAKTEYQAQTLETLIEQGFGFRPRVFLYPQDEFAAITEFNPFQDKPGNQVHVYFCRQHQADIDKIHHYQAKDEEFLLDGQVFYLYAPSGVGRSKLVANIEKCLACEATGRNINTINKIWQLLGKKQP